MAVFAPKIAALLALVIGVMSILAGRFVMRGWQPGWKVLAWLPVYNFGAGFLSLLPACLLWFNHPLGLISAWAVFGLHALVLALLLTVFRVQAAWQSLGAMTSRVAVWAVILALLNFL